MNEFNNGIFSPVAQQQNLGQMFADRANNMQTATANTRANFLADAQMPGQLAGFELQKQKTLGELDALPQTQRIAGNTRNIQEKFQTLQQMLSAMDDPTLQPEQKRELLKYGISQTVDMTQGVDPQMKLMDGGRSAAKANAYKEYFFNLLEQNPQGLRKHIEESMSALSRTQEGTRAIDLENVKATNQQTNTLLHSDPQPSDNSGASFDRLWKISQAQVATAARDLDAAMKREAAKRSIRLIVDQGQIIGQEKQNKDGSITLAPLDSAVIAEIERVTEPQKKRFDAAERGFLQLAPEQYTRAYKGQQAPTGGGDKPQTKVIRYNSKGERVE